MRILLVCIMFLLCLCSTLSAETGMSSDSLTNAGNDYILTGSVIINGPEGTLRADRVVINRETGDMDAEGSVTFEDDAVSIRASRARINLRQHTADIRDAVLFVKRETMTIRSGHIVQSGEGEFFLENGTVTSCTGPVPDWCVSGQDISITRGDRIKAWNTTLRVLDVPVLYSPYFWAPIMTDRKTGLLPPTFGYRSTSGALYSQPFFWAPTDNRDATITLDAYSRRGLGTGLEYRYVEQGGIAGDLNLYHIADTNNGNDYVVAHARNRAGRSFAELNYVNERDFFRRYDQTESSRRFLLSQAEFSQTIGPVKARLAARSALDLSDAADSTEVSRNVPEAGLYYAPAQAGPFVLSAQAQAASFANQAGDEYRRYWAGARIMHSTGRAVVFHQEAHADAMRYDGDASASDTAVGYDGSLNMALTKAYGDIEHTLEPSAGYAYQRRTGATPPALDSLELAPSDDSAVYLGLTSRMRQGGVERLSGRLIQRYSLLDSTEHRLEPIELAVNAQGPLMLASVLHYNHYDRRLSDANASLAYRHAAVGYFSGWTFSRAGTIASDINTYYLGTELNPSASVKLSMRVTWNEEETKGPFEETATLNYKTQCWGFTLSATKRPDDYWFTFKVKLLGLG